MLAAPDCPAGNYARQLALFLYETLPAIAPDLLKSDKKTYLTDSWKMETENHSAGKTKNNGLSLRRNIYHSDGQTKDKLELKRIIKEKEIVKLRTPLCRKKNFITVADKNLN